MKKGFTLIELLVVVLIIAILAAVAVPQYQKSVLKSKVMPKIMLARSLINAQELYYLENGTYGSQKDLIIEIPNECKFVNGSEVICGTDWLFDNATASNIAQGWLYMGYCPGHNNQGSSSCPKNSKFSVSFYYQNHPTKPGKMECGSDGAHQFVCKAIRELF